jgi:hypothetical protein
MMKIHTLGLVLLFTITISWAQYSALRIVVLDSTKILSLTMTIDMDTTLKVQGLRSDGQGWEFVHANWSSTAGLQNATPAPGSSISWDIAPSDTGVAWVKVSMGSVTPDSLQVRVNLGIPRYIVLYPADGAPGGSNLPYPDPANVIWDSAGKDLPVVAKAFDRANHWLSAYEQATSPVTWNIVEFTGNLDVPTGTIITPMTGYKTTLMATRVNNMIFLIANLAEGYQTYRDTMKVTVVPGKPHHLSLEPTSDAFASPHRDNPVDSVQIPSKENYRMVYAVVRDMYGNFITASQNTAWLSRDTSVVIVADGQKSLGQGVISRNPTGVKNRAMVVASSQDYVGLTDSTIAIVQKYYYGTLRIVDMNGNHITSLVMNINQDATLRVQGQRSDDSLWEDVVAKWEFSPGLNSASPVPTSASMWTFSPVDPGSSGWIRVTTGNDTMVRPDTVFVTITFCCPISTSLELLTPPGQRVAGDTIFAVMKIMNKDGLIPGTLCGSLKFQDVVGTGGRPSPTITNHSGTATMGSAIYQCFQNGIDTIKFVLYYAPTSPDSVHKITMIANGLSAVTDSFRVYPNVLSKIAIEDFNGKNLDSIHLDYPTGSKLIIAAGYDAYGNYRGPENSNWTQNGSLHAIDKGTNVPRIFYESGQVKIDEVGFIKASVSGPGGMTISDSVYVNITGPGAVFPGFSKPVPPKLRVMFPGAGAFVFPLPADHAHSRLFFTLYSLSGRIVFKTEVADAGKPVRVMTQIQPGIYIVSVRATERLLVKSRFVIIK